MSYSFNCPFCNLKYSEYEGMHQSKEISVKGQINLKCKSCKERFTLTVNMYSDLVTFQNPAIHDRKKYNKLKKRESRKAIKALEQGVYALDKDNIHNFAENWFEFLPFGGPFDIKPVSADEIHFRENGSGWFTQPLFCGVRVTEFPIWRDCPEEFNGKTFSLEGLK